MWKRGWGLTKALHLTAAGQPVVLPGKRLAPAGGGERRRSVPTCISILRLRSPVRDPPLRAWGSRAERPSDDLRRRDGEDDRRGAFGGGARYSFMRCGNINPRSIQRRSAIVKPTLTGSGAGTRGPRSRSATGGDGHVVVRREAEPERPPGGRAGRPTI